MPFVEETQIFGERRLELVTVRLETFAERYKYLVMSYFVKCHPKEGVSVEVCVDADAVAVPFQRIGIGVVSELGPSGTA